MKYRVIFIAGNQRQTEEVYANNPAEAKELLRHEIQTPDL